MRTPPTLGLLIAAVCLTAQLPSQTVASQEVQQEALLRRPVAIVATDEATFVANRRSGTISRIDTQNKQVLGEVRVGNQLADLDSTRNGRFLLSVDEADDQLLVIRNADDGLEVTDRLDVPSAPVDLCLIDDRLAVVASLWSRKLSFVSLGDTGATSSRLNPAVLKTIELPFSPREQVQVDDSHLVVADAFGGRLAVIDLQARSLETVRSFSGHNVRGMAVSPNRNELLVTHQVLDGKMSTTHDNIFWGSLMSNVLQSFPLKAVIEAEQGADVSGYLYPLGRPSNGTGDPADVLVTADGQTIISLSGVDEIALRARPSEPFIRRNVGRRPTALAVAPSGGIVYIANTLADSLTLLDLGEMQVAGSISLGQQPELSDVELGESLFYDARLSLDGWFSCHSCHTDGHTNGLLNDNFSDGHFGAPKRILSLRGVADTGPWAWNGGVAKLESQIRNSIELTMLGSDVTDTQVAALVAFVKELGTIPAEEPGEASRAAVERGRAIFNKSCADCHRPPTFTSADAYDVGIADQQGTRRFNPPSLRGVRQRGPYFHDNRAASLRDVFVEFGHPQQVRLNPQEIEDLLMFLRSL